MRVRLSEVDRERLGAPEWLECGVNPLRVRDAEALEEAAGIPIAEALDAMAPRLRPDPDGATVYSYSARGVRLRVWLGLRRAGVEVSYEDLDFEAGRLLVAQVAPGEEEAGKGSGSPTVEPPTPSTSASTGPTG